MQLLINNSQHAEINLYAAYIDFQKAFDFVDRELLFNIMSINGLNGKLYNTFRAMYSTVTGKVRANGELSESFECPIGLKQGCIASPVLFIKFIN